MFIGSSYWRGHMNVAELRSFDLEEKAVEYVKSLPICQTGNGFEPSFVRVYEVFEDRQARLIKLKY